MSLIKFYSEIDVEKRKTILQVVAMKSGKDITEVYFKDIEIRSEPLSQKEDIFYKGILIGSFINKLEMQRYQITCTSTFKPA